MKMDQEMVCYGVKDSSVITKKKSVGSLLSNRNTRGRTIVSKSSRMWLMQVLSLGCFALGLASSVSVVGAFQSHSRNFSLSPSNYVLCLSSSNSNDDGCTKNHDQLHTSDPLIASNSQGAFPPRIKKHNSRKKKNAAKRRRMAAVTAASPSEEDDADLAAAMRQMGKKATRKKRKTMVLEPSDYPSSTTKFLDKHMVLILNADYQVIFLSTYIAYYSHEIRV